MSDEEITQEESAAIEPEAKVETPETDATPSESSPEPVDNANEPEDGKKPNKVQERINQITREKYEERRAREEAERKSRELEERLSTIENRPPPEPREDDYRTTEEYVAAVKAHAKKMGEIEARQATRQSQQAPANDAYQRSLQKVHATIARAQQHIPDLQTVISDPSLPIDEATIEYLAESEKAAEVIYHLGTHLDEAFAIAQMSPAQKFRELAKLEAKVEKPTPNKQTKAPNPPDPIGNSNGSPVNEEKMPIDEWIKRRNAKIYRSS